MAETGIKYPRKKTSDSETEARVNELPTSLSAMAHLVIISTLGSAFSKVSTCDIISKQVDLNFFKGYCFAIAYQYKHVIQPNR